jgi:hypothetical protein
MKKITETTAAITEIEDAEKTGKEIQWEKNHAEISNTVIKHLNQYGTMPSKSLIASSTGLSRLTVHRHLQTFNEHNIYQNERESFGLMKHQVVSQILRAALRGDLKAAKLFLDAASQLDAPDKGTTNNYIQINKTVINQQIIQQLKPQQLRQIEHIIEKSLKQQEEEHG